MEFTINAELNSSAKDIYTAWLNSDGHTKLTGGKAVITDKLNERFTAWNGYISGSNILLELYGRIIQSWRTSQFEKGEEDSQIEIKLKDNNGITEISITHTNLPESGGHYKKGWFVHYINPMKEYFDKIRK